MKTYSVMFEKLKSIEWIDFTNRQKKSILHQFQKMRKIQNLRVYFYENGIMMEHPKSSQLTPIRTSPFPILNLFWKLLEWIIKK